MEPERMVVVGALGAAHGVRGALRLMSDLETPGIIAPGQELWVEAPRGGRWMELLSASPYKKGFLVTLAGVTDRDQAAALSGCRVSAPRSRFPEPGEGSYYWFDIIGLSVFTSAGQPLGSIREIIPTGSNDVYVTVDEAGRETLVPALERVLVSVDLAAGRMVVDLPEGL